jgi:hypothetical protein
MSKFSENNFSDMVDIKSFNSSFTQFAKKESKYIISNEITDQPNHEFNIEKMLPYGDQMRQLLSQSYVNKNDLHKLLNNRGVFFNKNYNKEELIPFFMKTFTSPNEFEFLRKKHTDKTKEESVIADQITTTKDVVLVEKLSEIPIFSIKEIAKKINPNIEITQSSGFYYDDNKNLKLRIETKQKQLTKDWARTDISNHLEIIVRPQENKGDFNNSRIDIISTNKDTKNIAKDILGYYIDTMKKEGQLSRNITVQKTLSNEFNNSSRTELLISFKETASENSQLSFSDIKDIEFLIADNKNKMPDDIQNLKNKVQQTKFSGQNLQDISYLKDSKYHNFLIIKTITAKFSFIFNNITGSVLVNYGFPDIKDNDDKIEFEFKILDIDLANNKKNLSKKENIDLEWFIKEQFNDLKWKKINGIRKKYGEQLALL